MKKVVVGLSVLAIVLSVTQGGLFAPRDAVAKVGKTYITQKDIQSRIEIEAPDNQEAQANTQNRALILEQLINETVLLEAAKKEGYDKTDAYKKQVELAKDQLLINQLAQDKILSKVQVTPQDVQAFYQANIKRFGPAESRQLSHIQVETKAEATSILKKLRSGGDFAKLARAHSKHASAEVGGDIGSYQKGQLPAEFSEIDTAAFKMRKKGDFSGIVRSPLGYHIVKLTNIVKRPALTLPEVQQDIFTALATERRRQATAGYISETKKEIIVKKLDKD